MTEIPTSSTPAGAPLSPTHQSPRGSILSLGDLVPELASDVFVAPGACVIGDAKIGAGSSIWFNAVIRADVGRARLGERVNVQDLALIHMTSGVSRVEVEDDVTIGHGATLHGCTVRRGALIGMNATVLDGAEIGEGALVGAGALVPAGMVVPAHTLALGAPARIIRELREPERQVNRASGAHYAALAARYRAELRVSEA